MMSYIGNGTLSGKRRMTNSKKIKPDTRPWKENDRYRKDETVINRLRAGHTLRTHGSLMEGLPMPPECDLCHSQHLLTDCVNLDSLKLRFFDGSNPNTLKKTSYEEIKRTQTQ